MRALYVFWDIYFDVYITRVFLGSLSLLCLSSEVMFLRSFLLASPLDSL